MFRTGVNMLEYFILGGIIVLGIGLGYTIYKIRKIEDYVQTNFCILDELYTEFFDDMEEEVGDPEINRQVDDILNKKKKKDKDNRNE